MLFLHLKACGSVVAYTLASRQKGTPSIALKIGTGTGALMGAARANVASTGAPAPMLAPATGSMLTVLASLTRREHNEDQSLNPAETCQGIAMGIGTVMSLGMVGWG